METSTSKHKAGVAALVMCLVLGVAGVVAAQSEQSIQCTGDSVTVFGTQFFGIEEAGNRLLSTSPTSRDYALATPLAAGTYSLNGESYDGYELRELVAPQTQEQWFVEFVSSSGSVLAMSGITADLADEVVEDVWVGSLGEVTLAAPATSIRVRHAAPGSNSVNSVRPVCIGATSTDATETPAPTTEAPTATTEAPVAATEAPVPVPGSEVTVDFVSTSSSASTVSLVCGDLTESATGTEINLTIGDIPGSTGCVVEYPADMDCTLAIDPASVTGARAAGVQNIVIPAAGDVEVSVTIDCVEAQAVVAANPAPAESSTTTTTAAVDANSATATTAPAAVSTGVQGQVETAPTATAQTGQPAFTG